MSDDVDTRLRARLHAAVDPVAPATEARGRIRRALIEASVAPRRLHSTVWNAAAAGLVAAVFAAALSTALVLHDRGTGARSVGGAAHRTPTPQPTATPTATPTPPGQATTLAPAVVPPAPGVTECSLPITRTANGNATPLFCADGGIDVPAWRFYASLSPTSPSVMALGRGATLTEVRAAMCADYARGHITAVEEESAEQLAARYYAWQFSEAEVAPPGWYSHC